MVREPARLQAGAMNESPPPADQPPHHSSSGPRVDREQVRDLGRLRRSIIDRHVAGVSGGLGRHLDIDPVIIRVAFAVLTLFGGAGILLYLACWLLVPEEGREHAALDLDPRSRTVALVGVGAIAVLITFSGWWGGWGFPWPLALAALIAVIILGRRESRTGAAGPAVAPVAGPTGYHWAPPVDSPADPPTGAPVDPGTPFPAAPLGPPAYTGPTTYPPPQRPRDPRKRGPRLFWLTMAVVALGWGILGVVDVAGVEVPGSGYPALAVAVIGVMLLVGAWFGRAGGLILAGLVATVALAGATAVGHVQDESRLESPTRAAQVDAEYWHPAGDLVLDLSSVADPDDLDGRTVVVSGGVGRLEVILPDGLDADVTGEVGGPGSVEIFGQERGGINTSLSRSTTDDNDNPDLRLEVFLGVGEIIIRTQ